MIKLIYLSFLLLLYFSNLNSQPNCNLYKWKGDSLCYHACILANKAIEFEQGSDESQIYFDLAIEKCPNFDFAYFEKAVPYLKRGDFIQWKKLIDAAININPKDYLGYRGWCRFQFLRDYNGAIADINKLDSIVNWDIGYSINGDYHLNIAKALCYKALGDKKKAIVLIENQLSIKNYHPSLYDYLHLGVLKLEVGDFKGAIKALKKEILINDYLAETYYYLALSYKSLSMIEKYKKNILKAKIFYLAGKKRSDPYTEPMDKIYLNDITNQIKMNIK